ncbi:hypothetical protein [Bradyrhizobium prioriisuperbiae]|uniref:hypothetical protein n=1 Tax=Bradyrhizobium prioriisuperbiae TaxID=2854389 RepID=UPI0028E5D2CA|nr:hypothetical protein [Bradyrhizobium prioritasuperba]
MKPFIYFETPRNTVSREAAQISTMLADMEKAVRALDQEIASEEARTRINDPAHFAYPVAARSFMTRRANLKESMAVLASRLSALTEA